MHASIAEHKAACCCLAWRFPFSFGSLKEQPAPAAARSICGLGLKGAGPGAVFPSTCCACCPAVPSICMACWPPSLCGCELPPSTASSSAGGSAAPTAWHAGGAAAAGCAPPASAPPVAAAGTAAAAASSSARSAAAAAASPSSPADVSPPAAGAAAPPGGPAACCWARCCSQCRSTPFSTHSFSNRREARSPSSQTQSPAARREWAEVLLDTWCSQGRANRSLTAVEKCISAARPHQRDSPMHERRVGNANSASCAHLAS